MAFLCQHRLEHAGFHHVLAPAGGLPLDSKNLEKGKIQKGLISSRGWEKAAPGEDGGVWRTGDTVWAFSFITGWRRRALGCSCLAWDMPPALDKPRFLKTCLVHRAESQFWLRAAEEVFCLCDGVVGHGVRDPAASRGVLLKHR